MKLEIIASTLLFSAIPLFASTTAPSVSDSQSLSSTSDSEWNVRVAGYGWFTALKGDVGVKGHVAPIDVKFEDIVDKIDMSFMGIVEVGRGRWSFASDLFYAKLSADKTRSDTLYEMEVEQFIGNFVVAYRAMEHTQGFVDVYAGARVNYMSNELYIDRPILADTDVSGSKTWVDPIIGVRFQQGLSEKVFLRGVMDVGGFDVQSDLTWQALAMLGYRLSDSSNIGLGYRGIGTDYTDGGFKYDVISHGLLLGFEHQF